MHGKKLKILFLTIGNIDHASSRVRAIQFFPHLEKDGFQIKWIPRIPKKPQNLYEKWIIYPIKKRIYAIKRNNALKKADFDILFIQKIFIKESILHKLSENGKKIIFDFDDAIYQSSVDKYAEQKTISLLKKADNIIVSSPVLKDFSLKYSKSITIIPSSVDSKRIVPKVIENKIPVIGWIGSKWTAKYIFSISEALQNLSKKHPFRLLLIGSGQVDIDGVNIETVNWSFENEATLLGSIDIGIMPLIDNEFEKGKGGYKLLQYMAAAKPVVASPVGINKEIVVEGENGYLVSNLKEWEEKLFKLLTNKELRNKLGEKGREILEQKYSLEVCYKKFKNVINGNTTDNKGSH